MSKAYSTSPYETRKKTLKKQNVQELSRQVFLHFFSRHEIIQFPEMEIYWI